MSDQPKTTEAKPSRCSCPPDAYAGHLPDCAALPVPTQDTLREAKLYVYWCPICKVQTERSWHSVGRAGLIPQTQEEHDCERIEVVPLREQTSTPDAERLTELRAMFERDFADGEGLTTAEAALSAVKIAEAALRPSSTPDAETALACDKCGSADIHTAYHGNRGVCLYGRAAPYGVGEHLHRHCRGCTFDWAEPVRASSVDAEQVCVSGTQCPPSPVTITELHAKRGVILPDSQAPSIERRKERIRAVEIVLALLRTSSLPMREWDDDVILPHTNGYSMWLIGRENYAADGSLLFSAPLSAEEIVDRIEARDADASG